MKTDTDTISRDFEREADRSAWLTVIGFIGLSLVIEGTTKQMEFARSGTVGAGGMAAEWLFVISSHMALIVMTAIIPIWLARYPLALSNWRARVPHYVAAFLIFSVGHIVLMVATRVIIWPLIGDGTYQFGLLELEPWAYEMRKDVFSFVLVLGTFITARQIAVLNEERQATRADAQTTRRLVLKAGGRQIIVPADEIVSASAAGNYVELHTINTRHFVRLTLSELAHLLDDAGAEPVRLHRSHLTVRAHLRDIGPVDARLSNGERVPVGRRYRAALG